MRRANKDIKEKIKKEAAEIFFEVGYINASMRDIATKSEIAVGSIYRYYETKQILFEDIVGKTYSKITKLIKLTEFVQKFMKTKQFGVNEKNVYKNSKFQHKLLEYIVRTFSENGKELYILLERSEGSDYADIRQRFMKLIQETMSKLVANLTSHQAEIYSYVVVSTIVYMIRINKDNEKQLNDDILVFLEKIFASV
ncbi:MAG: helix-turn-helix transcriptional regulator [Clostridia bacterium]|nr:helix-turn-helix transcriptional regulator [Clostridia bacterium]